MHEVCERMPTKSDENNPLVAAPHKCGYVIPRIMSLKLGLFLLNLYLESEGQMSPRSINQIYSIKPNNWYCLLCV